MAVELGVPDVSGAELIGGGGHGDVYRATERDFDRQVAVKVLRSHLRGASADRFDREMRAVGALSGHRGVITVHRRGRLDDGRPWAVMEYAPLGSLADLVATDGVVPVPRAAELCAQAADALAHAHGRGIIHRDVKPGNLLLAADGNVRVADFGIALFGELARLTPTGQVLGTVGYIDPAVLVGDAPWSPASDVYSLAVTFLRLVGLEPRPVADLAALPSDLRPPVAAALDRLAARRPDMRSFAAALRRGVASPSAVPRSGTAVVRSRADVAVVRPDVNPTDRPARLAVAPEGDSLAVVVGDTVDVHHVSRKGAHFSWQRGRWPIGTDVVRAVPLRPHRWSPPAFVALHTDGTVAVHHRPTGARQVGSAVWDFWVPRRDLVVADDRSGLHAWRAAHGSLMDPRDTLLRTVLSQHDRPPAAGTVTALDGAGGAPVVAVERPGRLDLYATDTGSELLSVTLPFGPVRVAVDEARRVLVAVTADRVEVVGRDRAGSWARRSVPFSPQIRDDLRTAGGHWAVLGVHSGVGHVSDGLLVELAFSHRPSSIIVQERAARPGTHRQFSRAGLHTDFGVISAPTGADEVPEEMLPFPGVTDGLVGCDADGGLWVLGDLCTSHQGLDRRD